MGSVIGCSGKSSGAWERGTAGLYARPMRLAGVLGALTSAKTDAVLASRTAEVDSGVDVRERMQGVVRRFSGGRASKKGKGRMKGRVGRAGGNLACVRLG